MRKPADYRWELLQRRAHRALPRPIFDFIDGGAGDEQAIVRNREAFAAIQLTPAILRTPRTRSLSTSLFGSTFAAPIGVAPMGLGNLAWPGTDEGILAAVKESGLVYCLSAAGSISIEAACERIGEQLWFQLYIGDDAEVVERLMARAEAAGVKVLILTVDAAWPGLRYRDQSNGFGQPLWKAPQSLLSYAMHPLWSLQTLASGMPAMVNLASAGSSFRGPEATRQFMASMVKVRLDMSQLHRLRERWPHALVIKGVLDPDDAKRVLDAGVDGLVVSNHGARQLGSVTTALDALPAVRAAAGESVPIVFDSGIRSGEDAAAAIACGADFVLAGRPWLFASAADGPEQGPAAYARFLVDGLDNVMAQTGCGTPPELRNRLRPSTTLRSS